jgi:hypothetical protein
MGLMRAFPLQGDTRNHPIRFSMVMGYWIRKSFAGGVRTIPVYIGK